MMTEQVSLSGKFLAVQARGAVPYQDLLDGVRSLGIDERWTPAPYNEKDAFKQACLDHRNLVASRATVIYGTRINHLSIELKEHADVEKNGYEFVWIHKKNKENSYTVLASVSLNGSTTPTVIDDPNSVLSIAVIESRFEHYMRTVSGGSVGKKLRELGDKVAELGCAHYLLGGLWWISDIAPDPTHDTKGYYNIWFKVCDLICEVSKLHGSSIKIRPLEVVPDEHSYGMVADAIHASIENKIQTLQDIFTKEQSKVDDEKMTDRKLNTQAKMVATITKQLHELDSRLNLGDMTTNLKSALDTARQDCAVLQSQSKSRKALSSMSRRSVANANILKRYASIRKASDTEEVEENS